MTGKRAAPEERLPAGHKTGKLVGMTMLLQVIGLIQLVRPHCRDKETLDRLTTMIEDRGSWARAHNLFDDIRQKTLKAAGRADATSEAQYLFEEVCAKTLYNLTQRSAPFDPDSPYWIIPNALTLTKQLGIDPAEILAVVAGRAANSLMAD